VLPDSIVPDAEKWSLRAPARDGAKDYHAGIQDCELKYMDWLPSILKHFGVSKAVIGALFAASGVLYLGPRLLPDYVDPAPREWAFLVVGVFAFTAVLLLVWSAAAVSTLLRRNVASMSQTLRSRDLSQNEVALLQALGQRPSEPLNLDRLDYSAGIATRLEILSWVESLEEKGLVRTNPYSPNLVSLTSAGRRRSLEIERATA